MLRSEAVDGGTGVAPGQSQTSVKVLLGDLLVQRDLVTQSQVAEALLQQSASGKRLGSLLVELGAVDELECTRVLGEQLGIPLANLRQDAPEDAAIVMVPEATARASTAIPVHRNESTLSVAFADPLDEEALKQVRDAAGVQIVALLAPPSDIRRAIERSYRALVGVERHVEAFLATEALTAKAYESHEAIEAAPVIQVVNLIITQGVRDRASDIHIEPQDARVRIRYRIDGALHDVLALPANMGPAVISRIKVLAGMDIVERRKPQDGQIAMEIDGRPLDIRVSTTTTIWGEKGVMRLLDKNRSLFRLGELGMPPATHDRFSKLIKAPFGMVICAGPTGSGKTTTLYAALTEINQSESNVMTIEDPVEYVLPSINQIQIQEGTGVTFAGGLKAILRQDPDIILVGEMRDAETARIGIQSALTGHFVLTSLHATDASGALARFLDLGIEPFLVASSVAGVVGQRLVRRICRSCRAPYKPSAEELDFYRACGGPPKEYFWQGEGCNFCLRTGFEDRIGVYELLLMTGEMRQLISGRARHEQIQELAVRQGMRTLRDGGIQLVAQDVTTISEVLRNIYSV
ncbi:MAG: GspE/PulE family protein [Actinomycetota bacterium]|nr:GspE/PulE family protein [Actinomycetota bacterium]